MAPQAESAAIYEQIKQVGMTYVTQRYLWWAVALFSLVAVPNLLFSILSKGHGTATDAAPSMLFLLGMPMCFLQGLLVGQIKMQFAHSRARLMPRFLPAHLTVLGGVLLTVFVLYPFTLACLSGFEPLGLLALAVAIGVPALWGAQLTRFSLMFISMLVFYSLLTNWGIHWWMVEAAQHQGIHGAIIAAGVVLLIAWLWRLCHFVEEQYDYQNINQFMMARRTGSEAIEQRRIVATQAGRNRLSAWIGDWWHDRLGGYYGGSKASLVRVLRYGLGVNPVEINGLFFAAMAVSIGIFFSRFSLLAKSGDNFGLLFFFVQFAILAPGQAAGEMLVRRRPRIAFEMLLPLSRTQLIDGLFAASARNSVTLWLMMNVSLGIVVATTNEPFSLRTIAMFVLLSASTMFAAMALSLRVSVWPSMAKRIMVLGPSWGVLLLPLITWATRHEKFGEWPFNFVVIGLLAAGARLFFAARRAWLNLEFV